VAKLQRTVRRQRDHLLQRESRRYATANGLIVVEKLDVKAMTASAKGTVESPGRRVRQKAGLNRSIVGAAWGKFAGLVRYKVEERGGKVIEVPAAYSSQTCHGCGFVAAENRPDQAHFECQNCGLVEHADVNAAKVILARGLAGQVATPKAPKKTLRTLRRKPKSPLPAVVPTVEACGGELPVRGPGEAGTPRREALAPASMSETSGPYP
jgi:transposase